MNFSEYIGWVGWNYERIMNFNLTFAWRHWTTVLSRLDIHYRSVTDSAGNHQRFDVMS